MVNGLTMTGLTAIWHCSDQQCTAVTSAVMYCRVSAVMSAAACWLAWPAVRVLGVIVPTVTMSMKVPIATLLMKVPVVAATSATVPPRMVSVVVPAATMLNVMVLAATVSGKVSAAMTLMKGHAVMMPGVWPVTV